MTMLASTGRTERRPCRVCGAEIEWREVVVFGAAGWRWLPTAHDGPCGMPCTGAAVPVRAHRARQCHGRGCPCEVTR